jgi:hypothetical protein
MSELARNQRVQRLIRRVNLDEAGPKKRAVILLLRFQPAAIRIRFEYQCPQRGCRCEYFLSYQLPHLDKLRGKDEETCGFYCPRCGWGNAGSRPIKASRVGH